MLNLYDKTIWKNDDGFYNLVFITGFIKNLSSQNAQISFDIQQSLDKKHIRVIVKKGLSKYLRLENNHPIKVIGRVFQNTILNCDFNNSSLVIHSLQISRPQINEISATNFNELLNLSKTQLRKRTRDVVNNVNISGAVVTILKVNNECILLFIQNSECTVIPVRITGIRYVQLIKNLKVFSVVRVTGCWYNYQIEDKLNDFILVKELLVAVPGDDIPIIMPKWSLDFNGKSI